MIMMIIMVITWKNDLIDRILTRKYKQTLRKKEEHHETSSLLFEKNIY